MASTSRGHLLLDECEIDLLIDEFDAFRREYITAPSPHQADSESSDLSL
jgi:hypothetical protein